MRYVQVPLEHLTSIIKHITESPKFASWNSWSTPGWFVELAAIECGVALPSARTERDRRWYVSMTWEDWPETGSYATVVIAATRDAAETECRKRMAAWGEDDTYINDYHVVDCFDLDAFIEEHQI